MTRIGHIYRLFSFLGRKGGLFFATFFIGFFAGFYIGLSAQDLKVAKLKYRGGGDWYANKTALPNLIRFCNAELRTQINPLADIVSVGAQEIFQYPFVYMTGHGHVLFSPSEARNLRKYLISGGFLHIDDNYGLDVYVRKEMKKVFPALEFVALPFSHPIYHQRFDFPTGLPKVHEHDGKPPQGWGLIYQGRLICFYSYESDLGNGWEDQEVYGNDPNIRLEALRMGANIISFVFLGATDNIPPSSAPSSTTP